MPCGCRQRAARAAERRQELRLQREQADAQRKAAREQKAQTAQSGKRG